MVTENTGHGIQIGSGFDPMTESVVSILFNPIGSMVMVKFFPTNLT